MRAKITNSFVFNFLLLVLMLIVGYGSYKTVQQAFDLNQESEQNKAKVEELLRQKQELEQKIAGLKNEEAVERAAKERFNLKKTGEEVVVVMPDKKPVEDNAEHPGLWSKIKDFFQKIWPWK